MAEGHTQDPVRYGVIYEAAMTSLSLGMHYTVQCQEEYISAQNRDYAGMLRAHPASERLPALSGRRRGDPAPALRLVAGQSPAALANAPVTSDIPALLLSGNLDPITPHAYAVQAQETLSAAFSYVLPHVGHGVLRSDRCAVRMAKAFIGDPRHEPDSSCIDSTRAIDFE